MRHLRKALLDIDNGTNEMDTDAVIRASSQDVAPELPALVFRPGVGALVNRNDELRRFLEKTQQLCFSSLHAKVPFNKSSSKPSASSSAARMSVLISSSVRSGCGL